jgi:hypothetical protein
METYIIRIYRRDPDDPVKIAGLVETVGEDEEKVFTSLDELCNTLVPCCASHGVANREQSETESLRV